MNINDGEEVSVHVQRSTHAGGQDYLPIGEVEAAQLKVLLNKLG
jgi:hypothetical protein